MFTTAFAIILGSVGLSFGATALMASLATSRKYRSFEKALRQKTEAEAALVFRAANAMSEQMVSAQAAKSAQAVAWLGDRLDGLELAAADQLITRAEVSAAFAELAVIEEQRQQDARARAASAAAPVYPFSVGAGAPAVVPPAGLPPELPSGQADPWSISSPASSAPSDPSALLREIAVMNKRLQQRMQNMNGAS